MSYKNKIKTLKVVFALGDYDYECKSYRKDKYYTVQQFDYTFQRSRNEEGLPYGTSVSTILTVTVRVDKDLKSFYTLLYNNELSNVTILYNPTFENEEGQVTMHDGGFIATGFLVDITEHFKRYQYNDLLNDTRGQMLVTFKILISEVKQLKQ